PTLLSPTRLPPTSTLFPYTTLFRSVDRAGSRQAGQRERSPFGFTNPGHLHLPCVRWRTHFHAFLDKTTSDDCYARSTNHRRPGRGARGGRLPQRLPTAGTAVPRRPGAGRQRPTSLHRDGRLL